ERVHLMWRGEVPPSGGATPVSARTDGVVAISRRTRAVFGAAAAVLLSILAFWTPRRETPAASVTPAASSAAMITVRPQPSEAPATPTLAPVQPEAPPPRSASAAIRPRDRRGEGHRAPAPAPPPPCRPRPPPPPPSA